MDALTERADTLLAELHSVLGEMSNRLHRFIGEDDEP